LVEQGEGYGPILRTSYRWKNDVKIGIKNTRISECTAFRKLILDGRGRGDESFCPVKEEENLFSLLNVVISKGLCCMNLSSVQE